MNVVNGYKWYADLFGLSGVLAITRYRLLGSPKIIAAHPPKVQHPVYVRLKTTDEQVYRSVLLEHEYSFGLPFYPKVILDAGANIGATSVYFANNYPEAKIVAVEPEQANFAMLIKNARQYSNIIPIHAALWNRDGEISIEDPAPGSGAHGEWSYVAREGRSGTMVRAITIRTLMSELNIEAFDLVKIDVEGAEHEVFESPNWLCGTQCLMIETHDRFRPGCSEKVDLAMCGFSRSFRGETTFYVRGQNYEALRSMLAPKL